MAVFGCLHSPPCDELFKEHILNITDHVKGKHRGSIFIKFSSCGDGETSMRAGRFLTFNDKDYSVVHELVPTH